MEYKVIGLMSGSSLDGLDIAYVHLQETGGTWHYSFVHTDCLPYAQEWTNKLAGAVHLPAMAYQVLHSDYGHYTGQMVNRFIADHQLQHQVHLVASHGHTIFHLPEQHTTAQLGNGAAIAAVTGLPVVSDLRAMDIAFDGQGAPIVPIGEKLLLPGFDLFVNLGGIANLSFSHEGKYIAFDVCPANRVLNLLAAPAGVAFDEDGAMARSGRVHAGLLEALNGLAYYGKAYPKSLANSFGTDTVLPLIRQYGLLLPDALCTCTEHIAMQLARSAGLATGRGQGNAARLKLLLTGGGALNLFLVERINEHLQAYSIETVVPDLQLLQYKEALIMALIGVLRWREEYNVLASVTGAARNSINGALWLGNEA